jgi:hypothetical protein
MSVQGSDVVSARFGPDTHLTVALVVSAQTGCGQCNEPIINNVAFDQSPDCARAVEATPIGTRRRAPTSVAALCIRRQ